LPVPGCGPAIHSSSNTEQETEQATRNVFQVFSMNRSGIESSLLALVMSSQSTAPLSSVSLWFQKRSC